MDHKEKVMTFEAFAKKAAAKIEARKKLQKKLLYIGSLDETIEIRALTDQEAADCMEYSSDDNTNDKYMMYYASRTLQDLAAYMVEQGMIKEHLEVCECINKVDRNAIVHEVLKMSGYIGEKTVKELDEVKK